ncbi:MAG: hypothetical protein WB765_19565, partial [Acidimicrobiales bacterium]
MTESVGSSGEPSRGEGAVKIAGALASPDDPLEQDSDGSVRVTTIGTGSPGESGIKQEGAVFD